MIVHFILIACFKVLRFCITKGPVSAGHEFHNNFNWTIVTGFAYMMFFFNFVHGKWHSLGSYDGLICNIECYLTGVFIFLLKKRLWFWHYNIIHGHQTDFQINRRVVGEIILFLIEYQSLWLAWIMTEHSQDCSLGGNIISQERFQYSV